MSGLDEFTHDGPIDFHREITMTAAKRYRNLVFGIVWVLVVCVVLAFFVMNRSFRVQTWDLTLQTAASQSLKTQEMARTLAQMRSVENGNSTAFTENLRELALTARSFDAAMKALQNGETQKTAFQDLVTQSLYTSDHQDLMNEISNLWQRYRQKLEPLLSNVRFNGRHAIVSSALDFSTEQFQDAADFSENNSLQLYALCEDLVTAIQKDAKNDAKHFEVLLLAGLAVIAFSILAVLLATVRWRQRDLIREDNDRAKIEAIQNMNELM